MESREENPRRRRRRRRNPGSAPVSRRRRRNPGARSGGGLLGLFGGGGGGGLMGEVSRFLPSLAGKLFVSAVVKRFGTQGGSLFGGPQSSPTVGGSWSMGQYLAALLAANLGAKVFGRFLNAAEFRRGGMDLILTKLVYTEGLARSPGLQAILGNVPENQIRVDADGQTYLQQGGRWVAMQGPLISASPLDGLVEAAPLDGPPGYGYGHLLPAATDAATVEAGKWAGSGFTSNYNAAYSG
jgi:hypothetical protein